jgi:branched-chain amino acid transport system ATP-binding protein
MLKIRDLVVRYGGITALDRVSADVREGETVILLGANGAGKSSLINSVIGVVPVAAGAIQLKDRTISQSPASSRAGFGIGYSPEGRRVFPTMSVRDNVLVGAAGLNSAAQGRAYARLTSLFPMLDSRANDLAGHLSGGQQQIVAIARAMSASPRLLLLDEPFLGLAPVWIQQISAAIRHFAEAGTTILMTEQMAVPALKVATRGYVMRGGQVIREGSVEEIKESALSEDYL